MFDDNGAAEMHKLLLPYDAFSLTGLQKNMHQKTEKI